jgi:hypothetical protein
MNIEKEMLILALKGYSVIKNTYVSPDGLKIAVAIRVKDEDVFNNDTLDLVMKTMEHGPVDSEIELTENAIKKFYAIKRNH